MKKGNWKKRAATMAVFVAMLIPMLAVTAYASSPKVTYSFTFNGQVQTMRKEAEKTDLRDLNTRGAAGVKIISSQFGFGSVSMWIESKAGVPWTETTTGISNNGSHTIYYYVSRFPDADSCMVNLCCKSTSGVQGLGGEFQP